MQDPAPPELDLTQRSARLVTPQLRASRQNTAEIGITAIIDSVGNTHALSITNCFN
jgi:hypothetical protein